MIQTTTSASFAVVSENPTHGSIRQLSPVSYTHLDVTDWIRVPLAVIGTGAIILLVLVVLFFAMLLLTSYRHNTR